MNRLEEVIGKWVIRQRWLVIAITVLIVVVSGSGIRFLTFNNDLRVFFSSENPQLQALEALENTYNRIDNVAFVVAPKDGDVFTRETLGALEELTGASWKIPYSSRVNSVINFQDMRAEDDELIVNDLVSIAKDLSDSEIKEIRKIALSEPMLVNRIISPSGHVTSVNVNILLPGRSMDEVPEVAEYTRRMARDFQRKYPHIDIHLSGAVMFDNAFGEATQDDMFTLVPVMFLAIMFIIGLTLRSFIGTLGAFLVVVISMTTGLGFVGWVGMSLNPASANAPTIVLVLAVADSVHLLSTIFQEMRLGRDKLQALDESLKINLQPVFLTSLTTAIGFLTMNFSDAPPFRDLGNIVAVGVIAALFYSVFFLPAFLSVVPIHVRPAEDTVSGHRPCARLAGFVINRRRRLFRWIIVVIVFLAAGMSQIELNDDWVEYFDERYAIRRSTDFVRTNLTGFNVIEYSLQSGETGGINDPEYLKTVDEFADWYRNQPKVVHVNTFTDTIKRLNKKMHDDDESYYRIPEERELAAQYLLLYELSLPFGLDLNNMIDVDKSATRMIVTLRGTSTKELRAMDKKAREWLKLNASETMFTFGSGLSIIWAHISHRNINSMLGASMLALLLISGLMIFALRSLKMGIISMIPNLSPAFMAFGLWGMAVGRVGLALSVVVAMTIGIVVDDTVHFMTKYLRARRDHGLTPQDSILYSFNKVGTAMWITTVALVSGFAVLTFSGYKMNSEMGLLTAVTISLALALDFLFLPMLLMRVDK